MPDLTLPEALERIARLACGCGYCAADELVEYETHRAAIAAALAQRDAPFLAALKHVGIEPDDGQMGGGWWLPAEPGPVHYDTLVEALAGLASLCDEDALAQRERETLEWACANPSVRWRDDGGYVCEQRDDYIKRGLRALAKEAP